MAHNLGRPEQVDLLWFSKSSSLLSVGHKLEPDLNSKTIIYIGRIITLCAIN